VPIQFGHGPRAGETNNPSNMFYICSSFPVGRAPNTSTGRHPDHTLIPLQSTSFIKEYRFPSFSFILLPTLMPRMPLTTFRTTSVISAREMGKTASESPDSHVASRPQGVLPPKNGQVKYLVPESSNSLCSPYSIRT